MLELQRMTDRVCVLILSSNLPAIDIEIEKSKVRERCLELYPRTGTSFPRLKNRGPLKPSIQRVSSPGCLTPSQHLAMPRREPRVP